MYRVYLATSFVLTTHVFLPLEVIRSLSLHSGKIPVKSLVCGIGNLSLLGARTFTSATTMFGSWRCTGATNAQLVENLYVGHHMTSHELKNAMLATDRALYSPHQPYVDAPQPIGHQATISAPHMHAMCAQALVPVLPSGGGGKILDVGCGSGYLAAVFARLTGEEGRVVGIDYLKPLAELSEKNVCQDDPSLLSSNRVAFYTLDGWKGFPKMAPYDAIHVGAAASSTPLELVAQLKVGGRMVVPVGPVGGAQVLVQIDRLSSHGPVEKSFTTTPLVGVSYVPLVESDEDTSELQS